MPFGISGEYSAGGRGIVVTLVLGAAVVCVNVTVLEVEGVDISLAIEVAVASEVLDVDDDIIVWLAGAE